MKYMVMECHHGYSVLMGEDASFVKAANLHYEVGQTVEDPIILANTDTGRSITVSHSVRKWIMTAAACLLIFVGFGAYIYNSNYSAYSSIIISADAEIRIELNSKGKVISVVPLNEQGEKVLEGYDLEKGMSESDVADTLVKRYVKLGYINSGDTVEFLIDAPSSDIYDDYSSDMKAVADKQESVSIKTSIRKYDDKNETPVNTVKNDAPVNTAPAATTAKKQTGAVTKLTTAAKIQPPAPVPPNENREILPPHEKAQPPAAPVPEALPQQPIQKPDEKTLPDAQQKIVPEQKEKERINENNRNNDKNNRTNDNKNNEPNELPKNNNDNRNNTPDNKDKTVPEKTPDRPAEDIRKPDKENERGGNTPLPDPNKELVPDNRQDREEKPEQPQTPAAHEQTHSPIKDVPHPEQNVLPHQQNDNRSEIPAEPSGETER